MRLLRLDLRSFGAFENVSIDLGRSDGTAPGLTIVYGPNEAGKSTALRAVRQLFFGIDGDRDAFRFPKAKLRIGGVLLDDDGTPCAGVRRGSRKAGLYDSDDKRTLADDSAFATLLARLDAASYGTAYGLDHDDLKSGAEAIAESEGSLDAALYAATARVKDLQGLHRSLTDQAENLFTQQARSGTKKRINQLINELKELDKKAAQARQPIEEYRRMRTEIDQVRREADALEREESELRRRLALLQRFADLFGDHVERVALERKLEAFVGVPLPAGAVDDRWEKLKNEMSEATVRAESAAELRDRTEKELASLGEPSPALAHADRIDALARRALLLDDERSKVENDERDRARLVRSANETLAAIGDLATRADLEALALPKNFAATIRELVEVRRKIDHDEASDRDRLQQMRARLNELESSRYDDALEERFERLDERLRIAEDAVGKAARDRDGIAEALRGKTAAVRDWIAARFESPVEPSKLPAVPIPSPETIEDEIERRKNLDERREAAEQRRREIEEKLIDVEGRLDAAAAENLPSPDDLIAKRSLRDETLRRLQARLVATPSDESSISADDGDTVESLVASLTKAVREADRVADVLAKEAERCFQVKLDRQEADALRKKRAANESERNKFSDDSRNAEEIWANLWSAVGVRAMPPREMRSWRMEWAARCEDVAEIAMKESELRQLDESVRTAFEDLVAELRNLDESAATDLASMTQEDWLLAARRARTKLKAERAQAAKDRGERELLVDRDIPARVESLRLVALRKAEWEKRWGQAAKRLPPASRAVPGETLSFLDQFAEWRKLRDEERAIDERRAAFDANVASFGRDVDSLASDLEEPPGADESAQVRRWQVALEEARRLDDEAKRLRERVESARDDATKAEDRRRVAERALREFCDELGVGAPAEASERLRAIREKRAALQKADELDDRLNQKLPGWTWADLARELAEWSPESLEVEIGKIDDRIARLALDAKARYVRRGALEDELKKWDGTSRAAEIEQSKQRLLAELSEQAELYATYRLAASALKTSIERYRERNKSPVLERAGKFFSRLTLGRYSGLEPHDRAEGGIAVLGIRASEEEEPREVSVAGMSRGTRDQLYLAFRMALWEARLEKSSPVPIVLDDVLVHFDDDRTKAALRAFDELARRTQIVYFTHHERLRDLAREVVPKERLLVCEL